MEKYLEPKKSNGFLQYIDFQGHSPFIYAEAQRRLILHRDTIIKLCADGMAHHFVADEDRIIDLDEVDTCKVEPGKDYYIYLVSDGLDIVITDDPKTPYNWRKIGGFHTLCADVGEIKGHPLSGYKAGDILPNSVWCLNHRSAGLQDGMVYDPARDEWVMIYLQSGTGKETQSKFGARPTTRRNWYDTVDDMTAVGCRLLDETGFMSAMEGSPIGVNIKDSSCPATTGGHTATNGQRIISNIGVEDGVGVLWQWLENQGYDKGSWDSLDVGKGKVYSADGSDSGQLAGGDWSDGSYCGSRARNAVSSRSSVLVACGGRGRSRCFHFAK